MYDNKNPKAMAKQLGNQLRKLRNQNEMTLEQLSEKTEVSKITLGNIERGEDNQSLTVIWKFANALQVPISVLLAENNDIAISRVGEARAIISEDGVCTLEPMFSSSKDHLEIYRAYIKPNSEYKPGPHQFGIVEYLTVMTGEIIVRVKQEQFHLKQYEGIRFQGDHDHSYLNPTSEITVLHFVMTYS